MGDPRYVALDKDGNIWTADYQDGRVQKFDASGKFQLLVQVEADKNDNTIEGLAADSLGNVYVSRGGDILRPARPMGCRKPSLASSQHALSGLSRRCDQHAVCDS
ncbi:MAG: hypothetical protein U0559_05200 [Anaerolineae bacterium]